MGQLPPEGGIIKSAMKWNTSGTNLIRGPPKLGLGKENIPSTDKLHPNPFHTRITFYELFN